MIENMRMGVGGAWASGRWGGIWRSNIGVEVEGRDQGSPSGIIVFNFDFVYIYIYTYIYIIMYIYISRIYIYIF